MSTEGSADWRRNLTAVTVATFIGFTGFTLVMPFLPLYLEQLGETDTSRIAIWAGLGLGITPAVTALMAPVWARVADRFGRKLMVARSLFSFVVIMTAMAFVTAPWQVVALRGVQGFFAGYGMLAMTMAAESAPEAEMARAIGWVQTAMRLGPALGPVLGGALAQAVGLRLAFIGAAVMFLGAFLLVIVGYREGDTRKVPPTESTPEVVTFRALTRVPNFLLLVACIFALQMVDRSFGPVLPLYLREAGVANDRVAVLAGLIFTVAAAAGALGNQLCDRLLKRWHAGDVIVVGAAMAAAAAAVFTWRPSVGALLGAAACFGGGLGVSLTSVYTLASQRVGAGARGVAFGYLTTASLTGLALSPVTSGLLGAWSMRGVFVVDALGLALLAWVVRRRIRR